MKNLENLVIECIKELIKSINTVESHEIIDSFSFGELLESQKSDLILKEGVKITTVIPKANFKTIYDKYENLVPLEKDKELFYIKIKTYGPVTSKE